MIKCERREPEKMKLNCRERMVIILCERRKPEHFKNWFVASGIFCFWKLCTFPPKSSKFRSDYLFSFQKRKDYLFPGFLRSEYLFPKIARPPSESNGRPLMCRHMPVQRDISVLHEIVIVCCESEGNCQTLSNDGPSQLINKIKIRPYFFSLRPMTLVSYLFLSSSEVRPPRVKTTIYITWYSVMWLYLRFSSERVKLNCVTLSVNIEYLYLIKVLPYVWWSTWLRKKYFKLYCVLHSSSNENWFALSTNSV